MAKSKAVWGIDIGQCALKALRCTAGENGKIIADKYDYIEYPKILSQATEIQNELIKEALEQFLSRNDVKGDYVAISVPGQAGLSRFFKPPPVDARTLPDIVKYEVKQQIPFPIEDVIWDWQRLGGTIIDDVTVDAEVGLFAMKREAVYRALQPFSEEKIESDLVQLAPLSTYNVVCHDILERIPEPEEIDVDNPPESLVVLSIGTDTTDLIVTNGVKLWLRNIPIGGNHFTKQLARELKLTYAKAELLKRNARKAEDPKTVFQAMRPVFNDLVTEIQRSLTFFQSMEKNAKIRRIAIFGNAVKLPGLRAFLNKQLDLEIIKVSSFKNLEGSGVVDQSSFQDNVLSLTPSYGLCIQGLNEARLNTNLLPQEFITERMIRAKKPWVLAAVGSLALAFLLGWFFVTQAWWGVQESFQESSVSWGDVGTQVAGYRSTSSRFQETDKELNEKLKQINTINYELVSQADYKFSWMEMFSVISQALPKDDRIKSDSVDPNEVPFEDRNEVFIDHIETKYFEDLYEWYVVGKPIYDDQFRDEEDEALKALARKAAVAATQEKESTLSSFERVKQIQQQNKNRRVAKAKKNKRPTDALVGAGYVIEIRGHHFHNSNDARDNRMRGRAYVMKTFVKNLIEKEFALPGAANSVEGGGKFKTTDMGLFFPALIYYSPELRDVKIVAQAVSRSKNGKKDDGKKDDKMAKGKADKKSEGKTKGQKKALSTFTAKRFDFVVQIAWKPRSPAERMTAKKERVEKEKKAKAKKSSGASADATGKNKGQAAGKKTAPQNK